MANPAHGLVLLDPQRIVDGDSIQENKDLAELENFKKEWEERRKVVLKAFAYLNLIHLFKKMSLAFLTDFSRCSIRLPDLRMKLLDYCSL